MEITFDISEIDKVAEKILEETKSKCLLVYGEMGAGKTTLIKAIIKKMGTIDTISSPTFSIVNEYATEKGIVYHFDFYRLKDEKEAFEIGIPEYLENPTWKFIEWPEKISHFLDPQYQKVELKVTKNGLRMLKLC